MEGRFAAAIAQAAKSNPMNQGQLPQVDGRTLAADGDGLCYYCAGNEGTGPGEARRNMLDKLSAARQACGAENILILLTARGSHKGHRYAIATVKPYQGQRRDHKPKNWEFLRDTLESGSLPPWMTVHQTSIAEADDLFASYAETHPDLVIYTQDKDMRMVPGLHLDWLTHVLVQVPAGTWSMMVGDKQYGRAWFWSQMLHGDTADHIPGLPFYTTGELLKSGPNKGQIKEIRCGEASTAVTEMLPKVSSDMGATLLLQGLYQTCYKERWLVHMLEQGILLWMRKDAMSSLFDVVAPGNPLHALSTHELYASAKAEIMQRILNTMILGTNGNQEAEDDGSSGDSGESAAGSAEPLRAVQDAVPDGSSGAGSRPQERQDSGDTAPDVQRPAGQDRELCATVRPAQPVGIPEWRRRVLAKARN